MVACVRVAGCYALRCGVVFRFAEFGVFRWVWFVLWLVFGSCLLWFLILLWILVYLMFGLRFAFRCLLVSVFTLCICVDVLIVWLIVLFCLNCI